MRIQGRFEASLLAVLLMALTGLGGCSSIQSKAVRDLIDRQAGKIDEATTASKTFVQETQERTQAYAKAADSLSASLANLHAQENLLALGSAAPQDMEGMHGLAARAFTYRAGLLYLETQAGLDKAVMDQFREDSAAMEELSREISSSWETLQALQAQLGKYSRQSSLASIDPALISALLQQTHVGSAGIDRVIQRSKQVNSALAKVAGRGYLQGEDATRARSYLEDLTELLQRSKP